MMKRLTSDIFVAPQIDAATVAQAAHDGVTLIINNRPDGESADQVPGAEIEAAAQDAGIAYVAIPVTHAGFAPWQIDAMTEALAETEGKTLCYCRSGTRSTFLWALSNAQQGGDVDEITETAAAAGYDVTPIREIMDALAAQAGAL